MSDKRVSWQPGGGGKPPAAAPQPPSDGVKRVERKPVPMPARPRGDAPVDDGRSVVTGSGRGLPVAAGPAPGAAPAAPQPAGEPRKPGGPSPFSGYAPSADELARHAQAGAESSNQVAAIVLGMGFVLTVMGVVVVLILLVGLFVWNQAVDDDGIADAGGKKDHILDTGVGDEIVEKKPGGGKGGGPAAPGEEPAPAPVDAAPTTGPVTLEVPEHVFFHSLEINCPDANIRRRASFRGRRASTTGVPLNEDCTVTFQGSEPAKTTIRGGQTKVCVSFNPTDCRLQ